MYPLKFVDSEISTYGYELRRQGVDEAAHALLHIGRGAKELLTLVKRLVHHFTWYTMILDYFSALLPVCGV
jgi:hypothetical protein